MDVRRIAVEELHPAPYNPRVTLQPGDRAYERLERSLAEFDLVQPLVWNRRTGHVVGGHQRLEILRRRGAHEIECVVVDLPLEREKALNVALNNSAVAGDWDPGKLVDLLEELQSLPDFDATLTGFDEQQMRELVLAPCRGGVPLEEGAEAGEDAVVTAVLAMPEACWPRVRPTLDALLASEPDVELHLRAGRDGQTGE